MSSNKCKSAYLGSDAYNNGAGGSGGGSGDTPIDEKIFTGEFTIGSGFNPGDVYLTIPGTDIAEGDVLQCSVQGQGLSDNIGQTT